MKLNILKMLFGQLTNRIAAISLCVLVLSACNDKSKVYVNFSSPSQGENIKLGTPIHLQLAIDKDEKIDQINYYIDSKLVASVKENIAFDIKSDQLSLGYRNLVAIVDRSGIKDTVSTNIVLTGNSKPKQLAYTIEKTFPHDTSAYTQGLSFVEGKLLESTGQKGTSRLKYVDLQSGKTLQQISLDSQYFGEGSLKIDGKIIMLTWMDNLGFVFDAKTFKQLGTFPYQQSKEGWGLTFDGKHILRSDGTNKIWKMNKSNYQEEGYIEVYDDKGPVEKLNELEYINAGLPDGQGKIFANVYLTDKIIVINPATGVVEAELDLSALKPKNFYKTEDEINNNVLNGIAWDSKSKRLFIGGKKWPKLYQIKIN